MTTTPSDRRADAIATTIGALRLAIVGIALTGAGLGASEGRAQERAEPRPIDGVVAIVGGLTPSPTTDVVLRSDVELRARLALAERAPDLPDPRLTPELLAATLQEIVGELLIAREAQRLHAPEPAVTQITRQRDELVRALGGEERLARFLERYDVEPAEIDAIARRRAFVEAFLRANLEGSTLISDSQVDQVYASGEHPFADRPLDEIREPLRAWLAAAALQRDVRRWIQVLRGRTPMRVVVPFVAPAEGEGEGVGEGGDEGASAPAHDGQAEAGTDGGSGG